MNVLIPIHHCLVNCNTILTCKLKYIIDLEIAINWFVKCNTLLTWRLQYIIDLYFAIHYWLVNCNKLTSNFIAKHWLVNKLKYIDLKINWNTLTSKLQYIIGSYCFIESAQLVWKYLFGPLCTSHLLTHWFSFNFRASF